jgi:SUMO ligase MMS21 Smc5/6 complex component
MPEKYNGYVIKLIEFVEKQTTAQIEQKNATKNLQKSVDDVKEDTKNILKKITKILTVASVIGGILVLAWGFISFSVDGIVSNKIEKYIVEEQDQSMKERKNLERLIDEILEERCNETP